LNTNGLASKIKELRISRKWTQEYLSKMSGVNRVTLASIETGKIRNPSTEIFLKLARTFNILPEELYKAAGYIKDYQSAYEHKLTLGELLDLARSSLPITIPVYNLDLFAQYGLDIPGHIEPRTQILRPRSATVTGKNIGFVVTQNFMEPMISLNDTIILDSNADISSGNIIACVIDKKPLVGKLHKSGVKLFLENNYGSFKLTNRDIYVRVIVVIKLL
jgi:transcriptional regulator with XRE-family HTH domain